jgi:hypothetical protein
MPDQDPSGLARQIEVFLLDRAGWVPVTEICSRFGIKERLLRQDGSREGLLDHCAVSSTQNGESGLCHHRFLPTSAWLPVKHRLLRHSISQIRKVRKWDRCRHNILIGRPPVRYEAHTGQALLPV